MMHIAFKLFLFLAVIIYVSSHDQNGHYTNQWVVRIKGGDDAANELAYELGYHNQGQLKGFEDTYLLKKISHPHRSKRQALHLTKRLTNDRRVIWADQQIAKKRVKRAHILTKRDNSDTSYSSQDQRFNDELWPEQWYLHDTRYMPQLPQLDMRVTQVWDMGYTGKGIVVTVLDDGLEWNHTDIIKNYDPKASWDSNDNDSDPFPRYDDMDFNNHGTRCAGEISMTSNNHKCGVGVAYNSRIGGVRMLDGDVSDAVESVSIAYNVDYIDIFSSSWGPNDDGMTVDGPKRLAIEALEKGIFQGRNGKGVIYVWASGNGGSKGDNCNCDGYTNSIYTLSVGSASQHGQFPWYGEKCASTMTSAYSSGAYTDQKITTSDLHNKCTGQHTGTSAAAPLAAGVIALVLEANSDLTWRDIQHLVVWTSEFQPLKDNHGWRENGIGLKYNSRFGFGLLDAEAMVKAAVNWINVPKKAICKVSMDSKLPKILSSGTTTELLLTSNGCKDTEDEVNYLEHVEVTVDIEYSNRGALAIFLLSPSGSATMILSNRKRDTSEMGFRKWTFLTVHLWGENPSGQWKLIIRDEKNGQRSGRINLGSLTLHGTKERPNHMRDIKADLNKEFMIEDDILNSFRETEEDESSVESEEDDDNFEADLEVPEDNFNWKDLLR